MKGYTGKVLWVDLTKGNWHEEKIPDSFYEKFLSGLGLATALLYREIPAGADPLGPENILGFVAGLLTGTGSLFSGRWTAAARSPLTGAWGQANGGGTLAPAIKECGYDGIFFKGISPRPVALFIGSHGPELHDAAEWWGLDTHAAEDALLLKFGGRKPPAVACIGPAGERLSLISGIVNDRGRIAARAGLGAVMGSKRLKALVLAGSRPVLAHNWMHMRLLSDRCQRSVHLPFRFPGSKLVETYGRAVNALPLGFREHGLLLDGLWAKWGTVGLLPSCIQLGDTPFKNWAGSLKDFPNVHEVTDPDKVLAREEAKYHCSSCPLSCGGIVRLTSGGTPGGQPGQNDSGVPVDPARSRAHKPEYETVASFTTLLLNRDMDLVYAINDLLNRAGMDTISAGSTVAFAMECYEKGWITPEDTGGLELTWGNGAAVWELLNRMIRREGFGDWLADGARKAAERIGQGSASAAMHAGGQEISCHDPRFHPGMGLHASVDPAPGRHTSGAQVYYETYHLWTRDPSLPRPGQFYPKASRYEASPERIRAAVATSCFTQFYDAAGMCMFGMLIGVDQVPVFEWMNAATGWDLAPREYLEIGRRIQTLRQMFNIRQGVDPHSLKISKRLFGDPPLEAGPNRGARFDLDAMMRAYWQEIGWDRQTGVPTRATLEDLGLLELVDSQL